MISNEPFERISSTEAPIFTSINPGSTTRFISGSKNAVSSTGRSKEMMAFWDGRSSTRWNPFSSAIAVKEMPRDRANKVEPFPLSAFAGIGDIDLNGDLFVRQYPLRRNAQIIIFKGRVREPMAKRIKRTDDSTGILAFPSGGERSPTIVTGDVTRILGNGDGKSSGR